jgi:hypothetical protein
VPPAQAKPRLDAGTGGVPGVVPGFGRAYFEVPKMPKADAYRVTVWSYERIEGGDRVFPR